LLTPSPTRLPVLAISLTQLAQSNQCRLANSREFEWQRPLSFAAQLGFDAVEWTWANDIAEQSLWTAEGRKRIRKATACSGGRLQAVLASYFAEHPLGSASENARLQNAALLRRLIVETAELGAKCLILPFVGKACLDTPASEERALRSLHSSLALAAQLGVRLCLQRDDPGQRQLELLARLDHPNLRAAYDTGRAARNTADLERDVLPLLPHLELVSMSRPRVNPSRRSGRGASINYAAFFGALASSRLSTVVLRQNFEGRDSAEISTTASCVRMHLRSAFGLMPKATTHALFPSSDVHEAADPDGTRSRG